MKGLILHAGAKAATREQVAAVVTPEATETHVPIAHLSLIQLVERTLGSYGLTVASEGYGLYGKNGENLFGVLQLQNGKPNDDYALTLGIRNSHDKSFVAGGALGSHVFVCDNLAFSGEITFGRMHTKRIVEHLPAIVEKAVGRLIEKRGWQDQRIAAYKAFEFEKNIYVHDFILRALRLGILPNRYIEQVLSEWYQPTHPEFAPRTGWSLFNAFTEVLKTSPNMIQARTVRLHALMDKRVGIAEIAQTHFGDAVRGPDVADFEVADQDAEAVEAEALN